MARQHAPGQDDQQNSASSFELIPIDSIKEEGKRHRSDPGDIDELARSIGDVGLLHPIGVTPDHTLIFGSRRRQACLKLRWRSIPAQIIDIHKDLIVESEYAENVHRKDFTPSEADAIRRALESTEGADAKERQREGGRTRGKGSAKFAKAKGRRTAKAEKVTKKSRETLRKIATVIDAAKEDPQKFGAIAEEMDRTDNVDRAFRQVMKLKAAEAKNEAAPKVNKPAPPVEAPAPAPPPSKLSEPSAWFRKADETARMNFMIEAGVIKSIGLENLLTLIPPKWFPKIIEYCQKAGGGGA